MTVEKRFEELGLLGAEISDLVLVPQEKLLLGISIISSDRKFIDDCELQFNRVFYSAINATAVPWFGIISECSAHKESKFMGDMISENKLVFVKLNEFYHFSIHTDKARIDVIAEEFTFSVLRRGEISGACC